MTSTIKNISGAPLVVDGVTLDPDQQLDVELVSSDMLAKFSLGKLQIRSDDETLAERRADVDAIKPFHDTGDPVIDGDDK